MNSKGTSHRIILLNFTKQQAQTIAKAGYNVERGFIGVGEEPNKYLPYSTPHPIYEYDILFYNSHIPDEVNSEFSTNRNALGEPGFVNAMSAFRTPPLVRVSFIGGRTAFRSLIQGGVPFLTLVDADQNVSALRESQKSTWEIAELHKVLTKMQTEVASVGKFYRAAEERSLDIWHVPVLRTRNYEVVMGYGTKYEEEMLPYYIVLPQMKDAALAVIRILQCLEGIAPSLFPDTRRMDWIEAEEFLLPEETVVNKAIEDKVAEVRAFIEAKQKEKATLAKENAFVRALLVAKEDPALPAEQRLSGVVRSALEFLDFKVEDIDQKIKSAIKKEDFWVSDREFLAITEVTGTENKNPKVKEFHDILGRMVTLYKRQSDLKLPTDKEIGGLLVLNYDIGTHPLKRPLAYTGVDAHISDTASEQNIGILSTVVLHKIIMAVKKGVLTKDAARELLKKPGRIESENNGTKS